MTNKKETVNQLLLGQDIGAVVDELAAAGYNAGFVVIGINPREKLYIAGSCRDKFKLLGILGIAVNQVTDSLITGDSVNKR